MTDEPRRFPILFDRFIVSIPWAVLARHERQAEANHTQSLDRIAQRGGLTVDEAVAVIEDRAWAPMVRPLARVRLLELVAFADEGRVGGMHGGLVAP